MGVPWVCGGGFLLALTFSSSRFPAAAFFFVFLANTINVLIILSPFTTVDAALKGHPTGVAGDGRRHRAGQSVGRGWRGRWSSFYFPTSCRVGRSGCPISARFISGLFTLRSKRFTPKPALNRMFLGRRLNKAPART